VSSWQTAKDELEMPAEFGQVQIVDGDDGNPKYAPNYQQRYFTELTELINEHTREELREEVATGRDIGSTSNSERRRSRSSISC
jgi:hypothetical protein